MEAMACIHFSAARLTALSHTHTHTHGHSQPYIPTHKKLKSKRVLNRVWSEVAGASAAPREEEEEEEEEESF